VNNRKIGLPEILLKFFFKTISRMNRFQYKAHFVSLAICSREMLFIAFMILFLFMGINRVAGQEKTKLMVVKESQITRPLEEVLIVCSKPGIITVRDGKNREYIRVPADRLVRFQTGGFPGVHTVTLLSRAGRAIATTTFKMEANTSVDDGGRFGELFRLLHDGMFVYSPTGYEEIIWKGRTYRYFVNWVLDNNNTMKGMQYFSPCSRDLTDLLRENQKPDGMIWSFVQPDRQDFNYYETAYSCLGYFDRNNGAWFVRQPAENHVEYNFVNMMYQHWKASGDTEWMKKNLECAIRALDYCITDTLKWSKRFRLLKRPYCIDSWDFQVDDEYTPEAPLSPTMVVVPGKTKFGIFFGDNTGYFEACNQLAEMLEYAGRKDDAARYITRGKDILERLIALSWNGKYFTHFIDEDPSVKRNLGVDEKSQIAQGNMYSINRGLPHEMNKAIIDTYINLGKRLPEGSPGEWYSIYPPFEKGFTTHDAKWQYMNGGVAGHAIGEIARGAYENGYEDYASDVMIRMLDLIKKAGNRLWFAYTGSIPAPSPSPEYKTIDLSLVVNMDLWDKGAPGAFKWMNATRPGNDMRGLPTGDQVFNNIKFKVINPETNGRRSVIGISYEKGFPEKAEVPVNGVAKCVYLLHSSSDNIPSAFAGAITFVYADGTKKSLNIVKFKDVTNWWFSSLKNERAGVAWSGPNPVSTKVGVCWAAIDNPEPAKKIEKLIFNAPIEGGIYTVIGITLADREHYVKPKIESFGGPDNWAAANGMAALVEGLAGVKNAELAFNKVILSPRWSSAGTDSVNVNICLAASGGYVSYHYLHNSDKKEILITLTGSGEELSGHVLLPDSVEKVISVICDGKSLPFKMVTIESSKYTDFNIFLDKVHSIKINYEKSE
jgi:hypothetical protein